MFEDFLGDFFVDEAEVPGFVGVAGDVFLAGEITEDEAELGQVCVDFGESFGVGYHVVVFSFVGAVGLDDEDVDGESGVVFGVADRGKVLSAVVGAFFGVGRPFVPNFLLFFDTAVSAVEFDLDAFVF